MFCLLSIAFLAVISYLLRMKITLESSIQTCEIECAVLRERLQLKESLCEEYKQELLTQSAELQDLRTIRATLNREREFVQKELEHQIKNLSNQTIRTTQETLFHEFRTQWNVIIEKDRQDWNNRELRIQNILQPVHKELEQLKSLHASSNESWIGTCNRLAEQIKSQVTHCLALQQETKELKDVLKNPNLKGRWGELRLKRIIEICGLVSYCDFEEQEGDSKRRPDLTIKLPGSKSIVIDAKTPMQDFFELNQVDEAQKKEKMKDHTLRVKKHVQDVVKRDYWDLPVAPVFIIIFFPTDSLLGVAMENDPSIIEWAALQNVILSTPSTLIGLLTTISMCWSQQKNMENSEKIRQKSVDCLKMISLFLKELSCMGKTLEKLVDQFNHLLKQSKNKLLPDLEEFRMLAGQVENKTIHLKEVDREVQSSSPSSNPLT
ncbi:DNA recombination protein RmuC [Candidatus Similichlamydia epinepheli]|uniref:DNA recombination protein RmuC n=1 Tax=Candidatus Similichlamydia epinepheli TaxID=1903953 RepID=UPI00130046D0|nr:DNA recombination protein RmuC [Candidatus Similichlamydia epinepheli]